MKGPDFRQLVRALRKEQEAVEKLDVMGRNPGTDDNEMIHGEADQILVDFLRTSHPRLAEAYTRLQERVPFWYA